MTVPILLLYQTQCTHLTKLLLDGDHHSHHLRNLLLWSVFGQKLSGAARCLTRCFHSWQFVFDFLKKKEYLNLPQCPSSNNTWHECSLYLNILNKSSDVKERHLDRSSHLLIGCIHEKF